MLNLEYKRIHKSSDDYHHFRDKFIKLYITIFSMEPFFEKFTYDEVNSIYLEYAVHPNYLCVAINDNNIVGFGMGKPLSDSEPTIKNICSKYIEIESSFYNSDVGTHPQYRNKGIGTRLVDLRISHSQDTGYKYSVMRTNKENSMSSSLYLKKGFIKINETMLVTQERTDESLTSTDERIFLWKEI